MERTFIDPLGRFPLLNTGSRLLKLLQSTRSEYAWGRANKVSVMCYRLLGIRLIVRLAEIHDLFFFYI